MIIISANAQFFVICIRTYTVGWSDFVLLAIFENRHIAADQAYFYKFNSENLQI